MKVNPVFLRTAFNYDREEASVSSGLECLDPSLAQQSERDECDINTIVKRFNLTGQLPSNVRIPEYRDFEAVTDYHSALNLVIEADQAFAAMPAHVRARFDNDAAKFLEFASDSRNAEEAVKLGIANARSLADAGGPASAGGAATGDGAQPHADPAQAGIDKGAA